MRGERQGHTLQTTALINEAFLQTDRLEKRELAEPGPFLWGLGPVDATDSGRLRSLSSQCQARWGRVTGDLG